MKRFCFLILILLVSVFSLFAEHFVIENYVFDISEKTKESVVRSLVVPSWREEFSSKEELFNALNNKVQVLDNKRVFKSVTYSFTERVEGDDTFITVTFDIDDAHTFLIIPYPKYDTNIGTILGIKVFDTNLLGNFSDFTATVRSIFPPESFGSPNFDAKFDLTGLTLGKASLSTSFEGYTSTKEFTYNISVNSIPIWKYSLNTAFSVQRENEKNKYSFSSSLNNISLWQVGLTPSVALLIHDDKVSSYITPSLSTSNIVIDKTKISFSDSVKFVEKSSDGVKYDWKASEMSHSTSLSFDGTLSPFSVSNTLKYTVDDAYDINTTFQYVLTESSTILVMENIKLKKDNSLRRYDSGIGLSQQINIGPHISIRPTLSEFLRTEKRDGVSDLFFYRYYVLSASSSGNYINWIGNFRDGVSYSISVNESWMQEYNTRKINPDVGVFDHLELTAHKLFGSWFNPSFRIIVNYTNDIANKGNITGGTGTAFGEYLRGVRNVTTDGYNNNLVGIVANLNLMTKFPLPSFFSFADAYANVFFDYGIAKPSDRDAKNFYGFGIEGIGILKSYPSYPVRVSLGFDLEKVIKFVNKEGGRDFYEIYIGLGFFF